MGGKPRKSNGPGTSPRSKRGRGTDKMPVVGIVERHGRAIAKRFEKHALNIANLNRFYKAVVDAPNAIAITDEYTGYLGLKGITATTPLTTRGNT